MKALLIFFSVLIPFFIISYLFFLKDPPVFPDEPVFYEMSKNLVEQGKFNAEIYIGTDKNIDRAGLGYSPMYFYTAGYWSKVFGSDIENLRFLSFTVGLISLFIFFNFIKFLTGSLRLSAIGTLLLSINIFFSRATRLLRMEILTFLFIISAIYCYLFAIKSKQKVFLFLSGIFSAIAFLLHPMGLIASITICLTIIFSSSRFKDKIIHLTFILIPLVIALIFWLLSLNFDLVSLISTYQSHVLDKAPKTPFGLVLFSQDFSWRLFFIVDFFILLLFIQTYFKNKITGLGWLISGIVVSVFLTFFGKEGVYVIYVQPFIILSLVYVLRLYNKNTQLLKTLIILGTLLYLLTNLNIQLVNNDSIGLTRMDSSTFSSIPYFDYHNLTGQIIEKIPQETKLNIFIASVPDPYFDLKKNPNLSFFEAPDPYFPISESEYKKVLDKCDYAFLTWLPHKFLADYIQNNTELQTKISQPLGYQVLLVKFKPLNKRI